MTEASMAEARYVGPDGEERSVQLPGTVLRDNNVHYDSAAHKGHLHCCYCAAKVNYDPGSETIAGGLKGPGPHFQRNAGETHAEDCLMPLRVNEKRAARDYDARLGYRIHLNTGSYAELFNAAAYPYERDADKKLILKDDRLRPMEPFGVKSIDDLLRIMRRGDFERLKKSIIIQKGAEPLPWNAFFIRYARGGTDTRFISLVDRLQAGRKQPVLMEIFNDRAVWPRDLFDRNLHGESRKVEYRDGRGGQHTIVPRLWLDSQKDDSVGTVLANPGSFLVLGYPRLKTQQDGAGLTHYLNISVTDRRQIVPASVEELVRAAYANKARREAAAPGPG